MYPLFVGVGLLFVAAIKEKKLIIGVVGAEYLPRPTPSIAPVAGIAARYVQRSRTFPPLLVDDKFPDAYLALAPDGGILVVNHLPAADEELLAARRVDAILVVEPDLAGRLERGERPTIRVLARDGEENSKIAARRLTGVLRSWVDEVRTVRFVHAGYPRHFDVPIEVKAPLSDKPADK